MHTSESVVVLAAGGIIATITVQAVTAQHEIEAIGLMTHLVGQAVNSTTYRTELGEVIAPVVGLVS